MSGYCGYKRGEKVWVRVKGKKVQKTVKDWFFTSSPVHNSDYLQLIMTDGSILSSDQRDRWFFNDNSDNPLSDRKFQEKLDFEKWLRDEEWQGAYGGGKESYYKSCRKKTGGFAIYIRNEEELFGMFKKSKK